MKYLLKVVLTREVELPDALPVSEQMAAMDLKNEELVSPFESENWDVDIVQSAMLGDDDEDEDYNDEEE